MSNLIIWEKHISRCHQLKTRASQWRAIAYPRAHQNSKCIPPVLIHRAIIKYLWWFQGSCSKSLEGVVWQSKKNPQNPTFWPLVTDPRHVPGAKYLHHCILLFIKFDLTCNMTMFVQNGFWTLWGHTPWPCSQVLHKNSKCVPPVLIHRAITCESFQILA